MKTKALILVLFLSGCIGFAVNENIIGNYYWVATDVGDNLALSYHEAADGDNYSFIISPTVFAIGYNEKYIIAKQHPRSFSDAPDKNISNYYVLPLKEGIDWKTKNGLIGPLTLKEFHDERNKLSIPDELVFSKIKKGQE